MKKIMLIGGAGSGKGQMVRIATGGSFTPRRALAVQYIGPLVVTPDEFLENRRFYPALIATSQSCDILVMLQSAMARNSVFPPQFATIFTRRVVGLMTQHDTPDANVDRAQRFLYSAGAREIIGLSSDDTLALKALQQALIL